VTGEIIYGELRKNTVTSLMRQKIVNFEKLPWLLECINVRKKVLKVYLFWMALGHAFKVLADNIYTHRRCNDLFLKQGKTYIFMRTQWA
jgi:hypothetical protein